MAPSTTQIAVGVTASTLLGLAAYVAYFDYKRQTDKEFRRKLRKENKKVSKVVGAGEAARSARTKEELRRAIIAISTEPIPQTPDEKERYFMEQVAMGEALTARGEDAYVAAAMSFYRALRIYPSPSELLQIYQKTVIEPVFKLVLELASMAASAPSAASGDLGIDAE